MLKKLINMFTKKPNHVSSDSFKIYINKLEENENIYFNKLKEFEKTIEFYTNEKKELEIVIAANNAAIALCYPKEMFDIDNMTLELEELGD